MNKHEQDQDQQRGFRPSRRWALKATALGGALLPLVLREEPASANAAEPGLGSAFRPERFGARGDGRTNDTDAFAAMGAAIQAAGGGVIELAPRATYIVGKQRFLANQPTAGDIAAHVESFLPSRILWLRALSKGLTIRGNGARLRAADGLRYGTFNPVTGRPNKHPLPYLGGDIAYPYDAMIGLHSISAPVVIENLELDGNCDNYIWGGQRGDTGWQLPCNGMLIQDCPHVLLSNVQSHHHGLDGLQCTAEGAFTVRNSRFHHNCRLNGNLRAGTGFFAVNSDFDFAGKGTRFSAPAGGFALEAEFPGRPIIAPRFVNCRFRHNRYQGMAADTGAISGASFEKCLFWSGARQESNPIYISKPRFRFTDCTFGGPLIVGGSYARDTDLPFFERCLFTDDPARGSLDGTVSTETSIINVERGGTMFRKCRFLFSNSRVPAIANGMIVLDECILVNSPRIYTIIAGTYRNCTITGTSIDLSNSSIAYFEGQTTVNGRLMTKSSPN